VSRSEEIDREFEGQEVLQKLLTQSGSLADVDDVAEAFKKAVKQNVPAPVVIQALWEDEPRFNSPDEAAQLFGNLLGLYELIASGAKLDLSVKSVKVKREKATRPEPFEAAEPDDHFIEAAWRYFDDFPKERQRHEHAFENRQDALVSWLDGSGLEDAGFALARHLVGEVFAMLELGGREVQKIYDEMIPPKADLEALPKALVEWIEESLFEAGSDEAQPLPEKEVELVRDVVARAAIAMWKSS
jgi:AcrR family transcriptional regulator